MIDRRMVLGGLAFAALPSKGAAAAVARERPHVFIYENDFDELWDTLDRRYAFFADKATDWDRVRARYRPMAIAAADDAAFKEVIRQTLSELYDPHTHVYGLPAGSPRTPPFDLLAERRDDALAVTAIEPISAAASAGLKIGDRIVAIDGIRSIDRIGELQPRCLRRADPAAGAYAINAAIAGLRGRTRTFDLATYTGTARRITIPSTPPPTLPDIEWRMLEGSIGYIVIRAFSDQKVVDGFNAALARFRETRGLIIDVSDNGGGDTAVARPIMGRFITEPKPYAIMKRRQGDDLGPAWTEWVDPRGPFTYAAPVVVLCSHWSGSMAEGFPMGMRDICGATIVGTPMMGLGAAVYEFRLDRTGIEGQFSGEPVYDISGHPRWLLKPDVIVRDGGDILAEGTNVARDRMARLSLEGS